MLLGNQLYVIMMILIYAQGQLILIVFYQNV